MALTDENSGIPATMLVGPTGYAGGMPYPVYQNGGNNGGFGGDWGWIILILLLAGVGGWGNGFGNGFGGGDIYPWLNNSQNINGGFRDQMLQTSVSSIGDRITSGFGDVQTALCGGFAGVNSAITNAQMANMQSIFGVQSALQNCCCENRAGLADVKYTVATEACADRAALSDGLRDVLAATQAQTQAILDKMCQDKIDAKNDTIAQLRSELMYARGQASQDVQTARILAGQAAEIDGVYARLRDCPVGTVPVFGNQPIFTCAQNVAGGCGCNNGFGFNG